MKNIGWSEIYIWVGSIEVPQTTDITRPT